MADETLNVVVNTSYTGASPEELKAYDELLKQIEEEQRASTEGAKAFAGAQNQQAQQAVANTQAFGAGIDQTKDSLDGLKDTVTDVEIHVNGLRRTASALNQLGLGELGSVVQKAAAIQQVVRQVSSLASQLLPELGAAISDLAPIIGADIAAFLAFAAPLLIIGAPLIALGIAFKSVGDALDSNRKYAQASVDALDADTNARIANAIAIRSYTAEQLNELKIQNDIAQQLKKKELDDLRQQQEEINRQYAGSSNPIERAQIADRGLIVEKALQKAMADLTQLGVEGGRLYSQETENQVAANTKAAESKKEEAAATKGATKASSDYAKSILKDVADFVTAGEKLRDENAKYAKTVDERVQADERAGATSALEAQIAHDKEVEAAQEGANKLVAIRQSEAQLEVDEAAKRAEGIQKINDTFMQNALKAWNTYYTNELRSEADYATSRKRKLEDLNSQLLDLAGSRDVAGFVNARKSGLTSLSRGDEDETTAEQRRRQDYEKQAQEAEQAREEQIRQLEISLNKETQTKRAELQKQEQDQIASNNVKIKQSEIDAKKLSDLQKMWAANDLKSRRDIEDQAHQATVARLQQEQQQLSSIVGSAITPVISFFGQVTVAIQNMFNAVSATANATYTNSQHTPTGGYASGVNYVPRDGFYKLHEGEKVTRAVDARRSDSTTITHVTVNVAGVGDLVSTASLNQQTNEIVKAIRMAHGQPAY